MKNYKKKYPNGNPSLMGNKWGLNPPEGATMQQFSYPTLSFLKVKTEVLLEKIRNAENAEIVTTDGENVDFMGFYFRVKMFAENETKPLKRDYEISLEPVFFSYKLQAGTIQVDTIKFLSYNEDSDVSDLPDVNIVGDLINVAKQKEGYYHNGGDYIDMETVPVNGGPVEKVKMKVPKHQVLEFYNKATDFGFAYISKDEIKLLAVMWKYLLISGAKMTIGTAFSKDVVEDIKPEDSYFTIKIEGEEWKNEETRGNFTGVATGTNSPTQTKSTEDSFPYPQMAFAFACPPLWHNFKDTSKILIQNGVNIPNYGQLAANVSKQWGIFNDDMRAFVDNDKPPQG